ncbi:MAG: tetratricopeptide repeat protein [Cyanobacteria bacterium NC_groundwater_1444_Ag_S-0.65um_54_12]|nr:tetratricopeptide repeat protein [Cyanobacteria bacterium NC_groundwater_1444_Ag_S-0.65um_54_12]
MMFPDLPEHHLPRDRLLEHVKAGLQPHKRLTLVIGGPGSGKTTLLAQYARKVERSVFWLSFMPDRHDPVVYFERLVTGLRQLFPTLPTQAAELIGTLGRQGLAQAMGLLCDDLAAISDSMVLILDDIQHLLNEPIVAEGIAALVRYFPEGSQLIIAGRALPAIKLAHHRLRGQIVELPESALAFTVAEVEQLLRLMPAASPDPEVIERIWERTQGWATGVIHALAGGTADLDRRLEHPALLYDFLAEELLERLPEEFQHQLMLCAFLPRLDAMLCRPLLGSGTDAFLNALEAQAIFVTRIAGSLAFHPIFREFLQHEVLTRWPAEARDDLFHRLAWSSAATPEDAVRLLQIAGDWEQAESRLVEHCPALFKARHLVTIRNMLSAFPTAWLERSPWLRYLEGEVNRREGNLAKGLEQLHAAEEMARSRDDCRCTGRIAASLAATCGARGEVERQYTYAKHALELLPPNERGTIAFCWNVLGMYYLYRHSLVEANHSFRKALALYREEEDINGEIPVLHNLGLAHSNQGEFERAISCYQEAIRRAQAVALLPLPLTYNNLALCYSYLGQPAEARKAVEKGMSIAERSVAKRDRAFLLRTLGLLNLQQGDLAKAREFIESSLLEAMQAGDRISQTFSQLRLAELFLKQSAPKLAALSIERALDVSGHSLTDPEMLEAALLQVEIYLQLGQLPEAESLLAQASDHLVQRPNPYHSLHIARLQLALQLARGNKEQAAVCREKIAKVAASHGYPLPAELTAPRQEAVVTGSAIMAHCLGAFEVWVEGQLIPSRNWRSHKAKVVLAYLLCHPSGATKEALIELLYPREDMERSTLHVIITRLRQTLEPNAEKGSSSRFILFQEGRYLLNRGVDASFDAADFRRCIQQARGYAGNANERLALLSKAVALYRGPFLEEFPDLTWCQIERENLRRLLIEAYEDLFAHFAANDEWQKLEELAEALLAMEPALELAYRVKMVALAMQERNEDALRVGQLADRALQEISGIELSTETRELVRLVTAERLTIRAARGFLP